MVSFEERHSDTFLVLAQRTTLTESKKMLSCTMEWDHQNADMFITTPHSHNQDYLKNSTASVEGCDRFI